MDARASPTSGSLASARSREKRRERALCERTGLASSRNASFGSHAVSTPKCMNCEISSSMKSSCRAFGSAGEVWVTARTATAAESMTRRRRSAHGGHRGYKMAAPRCSINLKLVRSSLKNSLRTRNRVVPLLHCQRAADQRLPLTLRSRRACICRCENDSQKKGQSV